MEVLHFPVEMPVTKGMNEWHRLPHAHKLLSVSLGDYPTWRSAKKKPDLI